jgi:hypothetical protein
LRPSANSSSGNSVATDTAASVKSDLSPLRLVAGLFGTTVDHDDNMRPVEVSQKPQYLNEAAFTLQREQQQQQKLRRGLESESAVANASFGSTRGHDSQQHVGGLVNLKFMQQPFFGRAEADVQQTAQNESLENQLAAALDDLEYMRGVALSNESDRDGKTANAEKQPVVLPSRKLPSSTLAEASKQLSEVISRHKKEVEQLTKERVSLCEIEPMPHFVCSTHPVSHL